MATTVEEKQNGDLKPEPQERKKDENVVDMPIISEIGIIYPPPEVRSIIEKTAEFVHKNGGEFEDKIRARETNNTKFSFLNRNDPYFMYYKHILYEMTLYPDREKAPKTLPAQQVEEPKPASLQPKGPATKKRRMIIDTSEVLCPSKPLQPLEFLIEPSPLSPVDLDTVRITAQFVAKNGRHFLQNLMQREMKNYLFDFLKPQHNIYGYYNKLVEQYTKILAPSNDMMNTLRSEAKSRSLVLDKIRARYEWIKYNDKERRKDYNENDKEKTAFSQIDWHQFIVVETISFREDEKNNLPPPVSLEQLGARLLAQERFEKLKASDSKPAESEKKPDPAEMNAKKEIDLKKVGAKPMPKTKGQEKLLVSPITGELIPADQMDKHMKIALLDPRYKEQKQKQVEEKRHQDLIASAGPSVSSHLKEMAQRRTDIFGPGSEETIIGKKLDEKEDPNVKRAAPVHFETRAVPQPVFRPPPAPTAVDKQMELTNITARVTRPEPPLVPAGGQMYVDPVEPVYPMQGSAYMQGYAGRQWNSAGGYRADDGRPKIDEELIPEEMFLNSYGLAPINIQVRIPSNPDLSAKNKWQLHGQIEHLVVNLTDTILSLKQKLTESIGLPTTKQKILVGASRFAKDANTLAFYNIHSNCYIALQIKERGGRK